MSERTPSTDSVRFPIVKFGARWVCDGPDGRFHAKTKTEAERLLAEALERTFACPECGTEMIRSPLDPTFLMHDESTDCVPDPWPTPAQPRYQPCVAPGCGEPVDTWLAGTTAAHRTARGVMHGDCYLDLSDEERVWAWAVELDWYVSESADDRNHDQEVDLAKIGNPGGAEWACVSPDGRPGHKAWIWEVLDRWLFDDLTTLAVGEADTEDEAKAAVAAWVFAPMPGSTLTPSTPRDKMEP